MSTNTPSPINKASRHKNLVSPFLRILQVKGIEWIRARFDIEVQEALRESHFMCLSELPEFDSPHLLRTLAAPPLVAPTYTCLVKAHDTAGYPTFKVRLADKQSLKVLSDAFGEEQKSFDQTSVPLDLHRLAALAASGWDTAKMNGMHAIHCCHNKRCFNPAHLYFGSNDTNRSTEFCPAWMIVNKTIVPCCIHEKQCLRPGERAKRKKRIPVPTTI